MDKRPGALYHEYMNNIPVKRITIVSLITIIGLGLTFAWVKTGNQNLADVPQMLEPVTDGAFGSPFTLQSTAGGTASEKSWPDKYKLIYFGFTYCPAICPTELQKMAYAMNTLGEKAAIIQPLFMTVDPERDDLAKMKDYVAMFHPRLIGLTGTPEQIKETLKGYKIYAAKAEQDGLSDYTIDHSSFIYFTAPDGRLLQVFKSDDTAQTIASSVSQWLDQEQLR